MTSRPRAGQGQGGELIALAMAAALIFFVGREAIKTSRDTAARRPPAAARRIEDTTAAPAAPVVRTDSLVLQRTSAKIDRAELRRRIEVGSPGTYIADMLADRDSLLTRWPERTIEPVRVWIQRSPTFPDWTPELFRVARAAFDEWGEVGIPLRFTFTVDSTRADVRVTFADRITDGNRLGVTTHRHDQDGWIVGADVLIAAHDTGGVALAPPLIAATARHEVGHALGLAHSRDRATIMYPESQTTSITGPDRATLKLLYTLPPGSLK
ncbi:MAG: matrixin family metalloprotease [Gemmatimonadaceae bacterium]